MIGYGLDVQDLILVRGRVLSLHPFRPPLGPLSVLSNEYRRILPRTKRPKRQESTYLTLVTGFRYAEFCFTCVTNLHGSWAGGSFT